MTNRLPRFRAACMIAASLCLPFGSGCAADADDAARAAQAAARAAEAAADAASAGTDAAPAPSAPADPALRASLVGRWAMDEDEREELDSDLELRADGRYEFRLRFAGAERRQHGRWRLLGREAVALAPESSDALALATGRAYTAEELRQAAAAGSLEQAVALGLVPAGPWLMQQPATAGEPVSITLSDPLVGVAAPGAAVAIEFADGRTVEASRVAGNEFELRPDPARAPPRRIGVRFARDRDYRWLALSGPLRRYYALLFDACEAGHCGSPPVLLITRQRGERALNAGFGLYRRR
ncbi:hypothetical protein [Vulcaniibacterium tengchongense]|uniref:Lipoprotein n=1 Tax=Vulcaniibacterium tengchongense TaxID=1273429 RepID=A0A3N4W2X2_9GAMM|nr:hypothetical protein [Vulcaniibacterium tengchongense]RPE79544.1 hypothetical protein EDC50_1364 [Vulcaniibacterium tengchongense]